MTREHHGRGTLGRSTQTGSRAQPAEQVGKRTLVEAIAFDEPHATRTATPGDASTRRAEPGARAGAARASATAIGQPSQREGPPVQRSTRGLPFLQLGAAPIQAKRPDGAAPSDKGGDSGGSTGGGRPLPKDVCTEMEAAFGTSFSTVRIHEGGEADALGAVAFARGEDLHFSPGAYDPGSARGREILGHELAHVVQQRAGRVSTNQGYGGAINADPSLEAEADDLGRRAAAGEVVASSSPGAPVTGEAPAQRLAKWDSSRDQVHRITNPAKGFIDATVNGFGYDGYCDALVNDQRSVSTDANDLLDGIEVADGKVASVATNVGSLYMELPNTSAPYEYEVDRATAEAALRAMQPTAPLGVAFAEKVTVVAHDEGDTANKVELHEKVHGAEHRRIFDQLIVPWDRVLETLKTERAQLDGDNEEQQVASAYQQAGKDASTLANELKDEISRRGRVFHASEHGKEAVGELKHWDTNQLRVVWRHRSPRLDEYVKDQYPELWEEVKAARGPKLEELHRMDERKRKDSETRREEAQQAVANQANSDAAKQVNEQRAQLEKMLGSRVVMNFLKGAVGSVLTNIVKLSSADDNNAVHPANSAYWVRKVLEDNKDVLSTVMLDNQADKEVHTRLRATLPTLADVTTTSQHADAIKVALTTIRDEEHDANT